jgi:hypothetical protein
MSARTLTLHHHRELRFVGADETTGIVTFAAASASAAGKVNHVSYDTITGAVHCDCAGAACGRACWHADWVVAAWQAHPAMAEARSLPADMLLRYGTKLAGMVAQYRATIDRVLPLDAVNLVAARCAYRQRRALAAQPLAA